MVETASCYPTEEQHDRWRGIAERLGMTKSDWMASMIEAGIKAAEGFDPGDGLRPVRSHFGRHWFTTYWDVHQDLGSELVAYMRGDTAGSRSVGGSDAMSRYLHVHYEDVEDLYRERIFRLGV